MSLGFNSKLSVLNTEMFLNNKQCPRKESKINKVKVYLVKELIVIKRIERKIFCSLINLNGKIVKSF